MIVAVGMIEQQIVDSPKGINSFTLIYAEIVIISETPISYRKFCVLHKENPLIGG